MASSVLRKEDLAVDEISTSINNLMVGIKADSIKNLRKLSQGLSLSSRLDSEEAELSNKQRMINAQKMSGMTGPLDRYQEGYSDGVIKGAEMGFNNGLKKGVEAGQSSLLGELKDLFDKLPKEAKIVLGGIAGLGGLLSLLDIDVMSPIFDQPGTTYEGPISGETFSPLPGGVVGQQTGQEYGSSRDGGTRSHAGVDITETQLKDSRAPFVAYKTGKVVEVNPNANLPGGSIMIDHGEGLQTRYVHVTPKDGLKPGDTVYGGQEIGRLHQYFSGGREETHLHFEVYRDGSLVDPTEYARGAKNKINVPLSRERAEELQKETAPEMSPIYKVEPETKPKKISSISQEMEQPQTIIAYQPIQSQTVVNRGGGNGGGILPLPFVVNDSTSRQINLAKSIA